MNDISEAQLAAELAAITGRRTPSAPAHEAGADAAVAAAFGRTPQGQDPERSDIVSALVEAGLTESTAGRVLAAVEEGESPEDAVDGATMFGTYGKVSDHSVPLARIRQRATRVLREHRESAQREAYDQDATLRANLRAALSAARGYAVTEEVAEAELDRIRQGVIRDGLLREGQSRGYLIGRVSTEVARLNGAAVARLTRRTSESGRSTSTRHTIRETVRRPGAGGTGR